MRQAIDTNDRWMAAAAWAGWLVGRPLIPVLLLVLSWSRRESLARSHALVPTVMWIVALAVWLSVFVFGILFRLDDPAPAASVVAVVLDVATLAVSIGGVIAALRSPVGATA